MLYLKRKEFQEMVEHSKEEFPNEACGILSGKDGRVKKLYKMSNPEGSRTSFFMDPREQLKVMKDIRNSGLDFIGIYHSHPETEPYPSMRDVELAYYPDVSYVIISLKDKERPLAKSFRIVEGKIEEEEIKCP